MVGFTIEFNLKGSSLCAVWVISLVVVEVSSLVALGRDFPQ